MAITPLDLPIMPILEAFSACIWLRERRKAQHVELGVIPLGKCNTKPWAEITSHPSPRASSRGPGSRHGLRPARQRAAPQAICMGIFQGIFRKSVAAITICFCQAWRRKEDMETFLLLTHMCGGLFGPVCSRLRGCTAALIL